MQNITLVKRHPCVQLGHFYEHLFMRQVNSYFYNKKLYDHLDYAAAGTTYEEASLIVVNVDLYSQEAQSTPHHLQDLTIEFGEHDSYVSTTLHQVSAEEDYRLYITDPDAAIDELHKLDKTPWITVDDYTVLDAKIHRRHYSPIHLTDTRRPKPYAYTSSLILDHNFASKNRTLLPLFDFVSRTLLHTICNHFANDRSLYFISDKYDSKHNQVKFTSLLDRDKRPVVDTFKLMATAEPVIRYIITEDFISRVSRELSAVSYSSSACTAPNLERLLRETTIFIGSKGWKEIATTDNIVALLDNTSLEISRNSRDKSRKLLQEITA